MDESKKNQCRLQDEKKGKGMNKLLRWELAGILFIYLVGTSLHFVFAWTNYWHPAALIAAVNESTWEHFKMGFWPGFIFALIEYRFVRDIAHNFVFAKFLGLLSMPLVVAVLFYTYTVLTGHHYLTADIIIFFVSIVVGQMVSYRIMSQEELGESKHRVGMVGLGIMIVAFSLLSYFPPHNFVFRHPEGGGYGILDSYQPHEHDHEDIEINEHFEQE